MESLPFDLFALDEQGRYALQNSACRQHWGDITGLTPRDVATDEEALKLWEENNRRAYAGEVVSGEVSFEYRGETRWYHNVISPVRDEERVRGIVGVNVDITPRKQAEVRQDLAVQALELLNRTGPTEEVIREILGLIKELTGADAAALRLREGEDFPYFLVQGLSEEFVTAESRLCALDRDQQPVPDGAGPPVLECVCGAVLRGHCDPEAGCFTPRGSFHCASARELVDSGRLDSLPGPVRGRCVEEGYESIALLPFRSGDEIIGLLHLASHHRGRFDDETISFLERISASIGVALHRRRAEIALRDSESHYRSLAENTRDAILRFDRSGRLLYSNRVMEEYLEVRVERREGRSLRELHVPDSFVDEVEKGIHRVFASARSTEAEVQLTGHTGSRILNLRMWPERDGEGHVQSVLAVARDITGHRRMAEELAKTERMETLGLLAGGIAHDFNNLIAAILGNISLVQAQIEVGGTPQEALAESVAACQRAGDLARQLLTFARGGSPVKKTLALPPLLEEACELGLRGSPVELCLEVAPDLWPIEGDGGQVSQVFSNLAINASHAMPQGGRLTVQAENLFITGDNVPTLPEGSYVRIRFQDQGPGIPPELRQRIFDPFFTTKEKGSGLGLSTAYAVLRKHGGLIEVEPASGAGAVFTLHLPASPTAVVEPAAPRAARRGALAGRRILVMDDDPSLLRLVERMLGSLGCEVLTAPRGEEALRIFREACQRGSRVDVALLDLTVRGGMGGLETLARLRAVDPQVKAVVASGYSSDPVLADPQAHGFQAAVAKPFDLAALTQALQEVLGS